MKNQQTKMLHLKTSVTELQQTFKEQKQGKEEINVYLKEQRELMEEMMKEIKGLKEQKS